MSNKNEVFEYLIDQLRQQVNKKDATSFNVSVRIPDLDEVKQVIHNLQQHIAGKDDEIRGLKDSLRQQVNNNQCEDLVHEVQSLKNQLRDASALVAELQETIKLMNEDFNRATNRGGPLLKGVSYVVGGHRPEQSGCRKEDAQECSHSWIIMPGLFLSEGNPNNVPGSELCSKCGKREWDDAEYKPENDTQECYHNWQFVNGKAPAVCVNCGVTKSSECEHDWEYYYPNGRRCTKCGLVNL